MEAWRLVEQKDLTAGRSARKEEMPWLAPYL